MRRSSVLLAPLVALVSGLGACGNGDVTVTGEKPPPSFAPAAGQTRYQATGMVLESPDHGPQLCSYGLDSMPPQCDGPDVIGWDWDAVEGAESSGGTTWGEYTVVGTWDGRALTLTEAPRAPVAPDVARDPDERRLDTPCPAPDGGWGVVDEATTTQEAMDEAIAYARSQPDGGGAWLDQSPDGAGATAGNDPAKLVLNLSFTGDLERHEAAVRAIWGGALCVSKAPASTAALEDLRAEVEADLGPFTSSAVDEVTGRVEVGVLVDDGLQERLDERYGPGLVVVHAFLQPVAD